jgi:hypothetical protein
MNSEAERVTPWESFGRFSIARGRDYLGEKIRHQDSGIEASPAGS